MEELKDEESVIIAIIENLLTNIDIKRFIDDSKDTSLEGNEIILETTQLKKFKIRVDEINS